jgi:hypothetical protein
MKFYGVIANAYANEVNVGRVQLLGHQGHLT